MAFENLVQSVIPWTRMLLFFVIKLFCSSFKHWFIL